MNGVKRSASWVDKEILKFPPQNGTPVKSVVLDGQDSGWGLTFDSATTRAYVPAGTILKVSVTNTDKHVKYAGVGTIDGILTRPIDLVAQASKASSAAPMYFFDVIFATESIVGFTQYASALVNDLKSCMFQ